MPSDLQTIADPSLVVLAWAAGLALVAGAIAWPRIVGPGFLWLASGVAGLLAIPGALGADAWLARMGLLLIVIGGLDARRRNVAAPALVLAGLFLVAQGALDSGWIPSVTATVALGGVTGEMLLGHWYLVDPRLPRSALRSLAVAAMVGLVADGVMLLAAGLPDGGATLAFWALLATSVVLMAAVVGALRYPAYSGVMAATGLSYLAVLTSLGAVFLGRALVAGLGPLAS